MSPPAYRSIAKSASVRGCTTLLVPRSGQGAATGAKAVTATADAGALDGSVIARAFIENDYVPKRLEFRTRPRPTGVSTLAWLAQDDDEGSPPG